MAWLLARTCFPKFVPGGQFYYKARAWSRGPLTAYMPEATAFPGARDHQGLYQVSVEQSDAFWGALARSRLMWINPFHSISYCDLQKGHISWFLGGQLNVAVNCLDRHVHQAPNKVALIWEKDEPGQEERITYRELLEMTCRLGNTLKRHGVKKGDRVSIYMPPCPVAVASMLACARIGAVHTVVFAGFSSVALANRIQDDLAQNLMLTHEITQTTLYLAAKNLHNTLAGKIEQLWANLDAAIDPEPVNKTPHPPCPVLMDEFQLLQPDDVIKKTLGEAETVITVNQGVRGGKVINLKQTVDRAVKLCPTVKRVFVSKRTGEKVPMSGLDILLEEEMMKEDAVCEPVALESEDLLFLLYTSGSTGQPKGLVHTQAGYLLYAAVTHKYVFDYHDGDVFGCVADIGWITGHSYVVYGPLCNGATTVLFESTPVYPNPGRYWETVERLKINQFYGAPTAIRLLLSYGEGWVKKYDRSSLKILGSVGEPIDTEAWEWYFNVVGDGRCPIVDTWWQTETGGICIAPRPSNPGEEILPAMAMRPFFGIRPSLLDDKGNVLTENDVSGALCIAQAWPGMARTIYNDHQRFLENYMKPYPGYYFTGDGAYRSRKGYYQLTGRLDDVINVSGHRLGTAEIEDVVNKHEAVAESAVIGYPHKVKGEGAYAFVVLKEGFNLSQESLAPELQELVSKQIAKYAAPEYIQVARHLPKTRSGKIMRRVLKKIVGNKAEELGDLTTLDDHEAVEEIIRGHLQLLEKGHGR